MNKFLSLIAAFSVISMSNVATLNAAETTIPTIFDTASMVDPTKKEIPAYLRGAYIDVATAKSKLQAAGYTIVGEYSVLSSGTTILFSDDALKAEAAKENRGFVAFERLYVDDVNKQLTITNPIYFGKAYMQDQYNNSVFYKELQTLTKTFGQLNASKDQLKFSALGKFHFTTLMPYYDDMLTLAKDDQADLIAKAKAYKGGKELIFEYKISDNTTLLGYKLNQRTSKFPNKIGLENGIVLPYLILIENGKAKALAAKYYIALSYPLLSMGEFMGISAIPGEVEDDLDNIFR